VERIVDQAVEPARVASSSGFEVQGVRVSVGEQTLLDGVDLSLVPGRVYGLIGHNGSGKSTLTRLLARQLAPTAGTITYAGTPLAQWPHRTFARHVGYMAQRLPEATGLTVRELASLGRYPWHGALGRFDADDRDHVDQALASTGMTEFATRLVDTLSGGERQRAWLAMLVAQDSQAMLLDEPISELDAAHQIDVMERVRELCLHRGVTVLAVLHDVNIAARFCDRLIALRDGQKIAEGSPEEVVCPEVLQQIYGVAMGVVEVPELDLPICYVA